MLMFYPTSVCQFEYQSPRFVSARFVDFILGGAQGQQTLLVPQNSPIYLTSPEIRLNFLTLLPLYYYLRQPPYLVSA
jgi:hypothetical protein